MKNNLTVWAARWGVPFEALEELRRSFGTDHAPDIATKGCSEAAAQTDVRLEASRKGVWLTRNNVGALLDERGVPVRYGLGNESKGQNKNFKSSDLIGIRPVVISPGHIGLTAGIFVAREMKKPGWKYTGTARERAQLNFLEFVAARGGDASFCTGVGTL